MPPSKSSTSGKPAKRRTYHHGDLRNALLQAAWRIAARGGLRELTLREVGVTHAAPYHHFPTRTALLDAMAEVAFTGLGDAMEQASRGCDDPRERMFLIGRAYIDFAREKPEQLEVMFRPRNAELEGPAPETLAAVGHRAFAQLFDAVVACQAAGIAPAGSAHDLALYAWTVVHGFSKLWAEGPLEFMPPYAGDFERLRDQTLRGLTEQWVQR